MGLSHARRYPRASTLSERPLQRDGGSGLAAGPLKQHRPIRSLYSDRNALPMARRSKGWPKAGWATVEAVVAHLAAMVLDVGDRERKLVEVLDLGVAGDLVGVLAGTIRSMER